MTNFKTAAEIPAGFNGKLKTPFGTVNVKNVEHEIGTNDLTAIYSDDFEGGVEYLNRTTPVNYQGF